MDSSTQTCTPSALILSAFISASANDFLDRLWLNFYFPLHAAEKEADFLPSCNRCWAVCLLYWQYFLNVCRIIVHQQAVLFFFSFFFASAAKHTNIGTLTWQDMKDVFNPSIHEVYLGTMCCLQDQTCRFHCFILQHFGQSGMLLRIHHYFFSREICRSGWLSNVPICQWLRK